MASKKVLGRGLGAFFPDYEKERSEPDKERQDSEKRYPDPQQRINVVLRVPLQNIRPNPHQPRRAFNEKRLQELAHSIQKHGLIQPITVRYIGEKRFELISGERRLRASKLAGIEKLPAYIREADDEEVISFALVENIQREDLNPIEIAMGYQRLIDEVDYTQDQVAQKVGKSRTTITNMLRLLRLPPFIQAALRDEIISMGHARAIINIDSKKQQKAVFEKVIKNGYSVRQTEKAVRAIARNKSSKKTSKNTVLKHAPMFKEISGRLRRTLSTKVHIQPKKNGGEIRIEFYSDDELERLLEKFDSIS